MGMSRSTLCFMLLALNLGASAASPAAVFPRSGEPPLLGVRWSHDAAGNEAKRAYRQVRSTANTSSSTGGSDLLLYQGGGVQLTTNITAIFWGINWAETVDVYKNPGFVLDQIAGIDRFYTGYSGTDYEKASVVQYSQTSGAQLQYIQAGGTTYGGHLIDSGPAGSPTSTKAPLQEVCDAIAHSQQSVLPATMNAGGLTNPVDTLNTHKAIVPKGDGTDYFPLYSDQSPPNGYCAYHSNGTCKWSMPVTTANGSKVTSMPVTFGVFFHYSAAIGCDSGDGPYQQNVQNPATSASVLMPVSNYTGHSQILAALADNSVHELTETRTDPGWAVNSNGSLNTAKAASAWRDSSGAEISDKCAWDSGPGTNFFPSGYVGNTPAYPPYAYTGEGTTSTVATRCPVSFNSTNPTGRAFNSTYA